MEVNDKIPAGVEIARFAEKLADEFPQMAKGIEKVLKSWHDEAAAVYEKEWADNPPVVIEDEPVDEEEEVPTVRLPKKSDKTFREEARKWLTQEGELDNLSAQSVH